MQTYSPQWKIKIKQKIIYWLQNETYVQLSNCFWIPRSLFHKNKGRVEQLRYFNITAYRRFTGRRLYRNIKNLPRRYTDLQRRCQ